MTKESFAQWTTLISEDPTLQSKVVQAQEKLASSIQEVIDLAKSKGIELEVADFFSVAASSTEDQELAAVAGGGTGCNSNASSACNLGFGMTLGTSPVASAVFGCVQAPSTIG